MAAPIPHLLHHISPIYRIYFLTIEPILALFGTYLCISQPQRFLLGTLPHPAYSSFTSSPTSTIPLTPLHTFLLTNIGSLYVLFAINEALVLRLTREKKVWIGIMIGMLVSDIGHIYGVWKVAPQRMGMMGSWEVDEWVNYGTLILGTVLRAAFVGGWGRV